MSSGIRYIVFLFLPWQHPIQQLFSFLSFNVQLLGTLAYQLLQIIRILFEHLKHRVHKVNLASVIEHLEALVDPTK